MGGLGRQCYRKPSGLVQEAGLSRLTAHRTIQATPVRQEHKLKEANNLSDTYPWTLTSCFVWDCQTIPSGRWSTLVSPAFIFSEPPTLHVEPGATHL